MWFCLQKAKFQRFVFLSCLLLGVFSLVSVVYVHCSCLLAIILFFSVDWCPLLFLAVCCWFLVVVVLVFLVVAVVVVVVVVVAVAVAVVVVFEFLLTGIRRRHHHWARVEWCVGKSEMSSIFSNLGLGRARRPQKPSPLFPYWYQCYGWWKKSCTSSNGKYPIIFRVLYVPGDAGILPSIVTFVLSMFTNETNRCHRWYTSIDGSKESKSDAWESVTAWSPVI